MEHCSTDLVTRNLPGYPFDEFNSIFQESQSTFNDKVTLFHWIGLGNCMLPKPKYPTAYLQPWYMTMQSVVNEHPTIVQELPQLPRPTDTSGQVETVV